MAALLTSVGDDKDKSALYLNECRHMGIKVLPPDVNSSIGFFAAVGEDIRFGLQAVRNVGGNVVEAIVQAREEKGEFSSFADFLNKVPAVVCNKRTIESLVKAGAFDSLGHPRHGLVRIHEQYVDALVDVKRKEAIGQDSLFASFGFGEEDAGENPMDAMSGLPAIPDLEWDKATELAFEREMLGLYVSDHPLFGIEHVLSQHADTSVSSLNLPVEDGGRSDGAIVTVAGLITGLQLKRTKNGELWAIVTVEDLQGSVECLFFPKTYMTVSTMLSTDVVCTVKGRVNRRDDATSLYAQELTLPDITEGPRGPVVLTLPASRATQRLAERLKDVLCEHPGVTEVQIKLTQPGRGVLMRLDDSLRVSASPELFGDLKALLGTSCLDV